MSLDWMGAVAAIFTGVAASVGAVVAFEQLTAGARARRDVAFLDSAALGEPELSPQREYLLRLRRGRVARWVAICTVPTWRLALAAVGYVAGAAMAFAGGLVLHMTVGQFGGPFALILSIAVCAGLLWYSSRSLTRGWFARRRVARAYLDGILPLTLDGRVESTGHSERGLATAWAIGTFFAFVGLGGMMVIPREVPAHLALYGGAGLLTLTWLWARDFHTPDDSKRLAAPEGASPPDKLEAATSADASKPQADESGMAIQGSG